MRSAEPKYRLDVVDPLIEAPYALTRHRQIYLLCSDKNEFDPRQHVVYPFVEFTSFNRSYYARDRWPEPTPRLTCKWPVCEHCGDEIEGNFAGYATWYLVFRGPRDAHAYCHSDCYKAAHPGFEDMPHFYEQQYGYLRPVRMPDRFKSSHDHIIAYRMGPNEYHLNKWLDAIREGKGGLKAADIEDFGTGGSYCGNMRYDYSPNKIRVLDADLKTMSTLSKKDVARLLNEILIAAADPPEKEEYPAPNNRGQFVLEFPE